MRTARRVLCVAACLLAGGCFESDEERALAAYDRRDYAEAWHLARTLADAGNPRGHELRALMAAQGLGTAIDFAGAFAAIDEAVAIDPSYAASRARLDTFVERTATRAQAAFDAAAWEHAMALAAPLEAFGHEAGGALANRLVTGGYVALPGSAMAWRAFWNDCAGNTRRDGADAGASVFAERCRGIAAASWPRRRSTAVWDGTVSARRGDTLLLRMRPGRPRARHDLALRLRRPADPTLAAVGGKVRFRGTVEARGDSQRPDVLADAEVLGPAALTPAERARAMTLARGRAAGACRRLLYDRFLGADAPAWTRSWRASLPAEERDRLRLYTFVAIESPPDAYERDDDGGWRARLVGRATVQAPNAQIASVSEFVALCRIEPAPDAVPSADLGGTIAFERLDEPRMGS